MAKKNKKSKNDAEVIGFVGVGLDGTDDHTRITKTENFVLVGGSEETHERMQDTTIRFNEALENRGKTLEEASMQELLDLLARAMDD